MPLINCPDCQGAVSSAAPACIHCGAPLQSAQPTTAPTVDQPTPSPGAGMGWALKTLLWLGGGFAALMAVGSMNASPERDAARHAAQKAECSRALASSIGTSTTGYSDKAAYQARVRQACEGMEINGKDLGNFGR